MSSKNHLLSNGTGRLYKQAPDIPASSDEQETAQIVSRNDHHYLTIDQGVADFLGQRQPTPEEIMITKEEQLLLGDGEGDDDLSELIGDQSETEPVRKRSEETFKPIIMGHVPTATYFPVRDVNRGLGSPGNPSPVRQVTPAVRAHVNVVGVIIPAPEDTDIAEAIEERMGVRSKRTHHEDREHSQEKFSGKIRIKVAVRKLKHMLRRR